MCVERTASTNVPSARESRASVVCQFRAAACADMLCANLDCVWLVFSALKVAQGEKQIYQESLGKLTEARSAKMHDDQASPGAGTGPVTGDGVRCRAVITRMTAVR